MVSRFAGQIERRALDRILPLAVPVMLEIGREMVFGNEDDLLIDAEAMIAEATGWFSEGAQTNQCAAGG